MRLRLYSAQLGHGFGSEQGPQAPLGWYSRFSLLFRVGGWWVVGVLDEIKALLSPAGAWAWAELGKNYSDNSMNIVNMII